MLLHGPVRVGMDARSGPATMIVTLPETSAFKSFPTRLAVVIE
ncbi:MAG TPA: hypothetical protein VFD82_16025 [Planctomycetota bacterium]|nr:hypothetical protein [Planctomycetota bacterium]